MERHRFLDAARGTAMLFVFLAHFGWIYFLGFDGRMEPTLLLTVGLVASPSFMIISGLLAGFLYQLRGRRFGELQLKLMDRGIFLLTIGRLLMSGADVFLAGGVRQALTYAPITDAIGVAILVGPWLMMRLRAVPRAILAGGLYLGSWAMVFGWHPSNWAGHLVKETLFGPLGDMGAYFYVFPWIPWLGLYLTATIAGESLGRWVKAGDAAAVEGRLMRLGFGWVGSGVLITAAYEVLRQLRNDDRPLGEAAHMLLSPFQKLPPSPTYFLCYGGVGIGIVALTYIWERRGRTTAPLRALGVLGEASLFVFVLQAYVYETGLFLLALPVTWHWPLLFVATVVLIYIPARWWARHGLNRFITVGLVPFLDWTQWNRRPGSEAAK